MALSQVADHQPRGDVESGIEVGGAVPAVIVGGPGRGRGQEGQDRRRALEGLDLRLLIDAQHDRRLGRVQVEADDVTHLLDEERVGGELEVFELVGLEPEGSPDAAHRRLAHPGRFGHRAGRPVGGVRRCLLQGLCDHPLHIVV